MKLLTKLLFLSLILALWPLTGCGQPEPEPTPQPAPEGTPLPFHSIERDEWEGTGYPGEEPALIVVTAPEEASKLAAFISEEALYTLETIDFNEKVVVGVFRGNKAVGPYEVIVEQVTRHNDVIHIYAIFIEPNEVATEAETSAYELILIQNLDPPATPELTFRLTARREKVKIATPDEEFSGKDFVYP